MTIIHEARSITVDKIADLQNIRPLDGQTVSTRGHSIVGKGANRFTYHATGRPATANEGFVVFGNAGTGTDWYEAEDQTLVNVSKFGVDGSGDVASFTTAVATAISNQVPLYIPKGNVDLSALSGALNVTGSLAIIGDGSTSTITGPSTAIYLFEIAGTSGAKITCERVKFSTFLRVFSFTGNAANDPYSINIDNCFADNFGAGIVGSGSGVYSKFSSVRIQNCQMTNMGLDNTTTKAYGIDLAISECPSTIVAGNSIDTVGSLSNTNQVIGISVDCSPSTDKTQSVVISQNLVKDVKSNGTSGGLQMVGIFAIECHAVINDNIIDTVEAPLHASSPEAIYTKCQHAIVTNNAITDVLGTEAVINMKGELTGSSSGERSIIANNNINYRSTISDPSKGILLGAPHITCVSNVIEGATTGIVALYPGTSISSNVFRGVQDVCIDVQPATGTTMDCVIKNNVMQDCGEAPNTNTWAVLIQLSGTQAMGLLEVSGNTMYGFLGTNKFGFRGIHTGSGTLANLLIKNNIFVGLDACSYTNGSGAITRTEFIGNTCIGSPSTIHSTSSLSGTEVITGNTLNAAAWTGNNPITNAQLSDVATSTIKGRSTAGTGDLEDLTAAQARTILNVADGATANSSDATLLARANHTGTQLASTIVDLNIEDLGSLASGTQNFLFNNGSGHYKKVTATGAIALQFTATIPGHYIAEVVMDGTGGHAITYATTVTGTAPVINTTIAAKTIIPLFYDGTTWFHTGPANRRNLQDTVTFSATPTFDFDTAAADNKLMTLTADITSSTFTATRPGEYVLILVQDATGGWEFVFPSNIKGSPPQPDATALVTTVYRLYFDGTNFHF